MSLSLLGIKRAWIARIASAGVFFFYTAMPPPPPLYRHVPCGAGDEMYAWFPHMGYTISFHTEQQKKTRCPFNLAIFVIGRVNKRQGRGTPYFIIADTSIMHPTHFVRKHKKASHVYYVSIHCSLSLFFFLFHQKE